MKTAHNIALLIFYGITYGLFKDTSRVKRLLGLVKKHPVLSAWAALLNYWFLHTIARHNGLLSRKKLSGQHAFITGGGMGIGRQMALILAKKGCRITIADINLEAANKTAQEINSTTTSAIVVQCDVSNYESVQQAIKNSVEKNGPVDILINNAGIVSGKKLLENNPKLMEKTIQVNVTAHNFTVKEVLQSMIDRKRGHIVSIASISGMFGVCGLVDYCASKFGAIGFDEALRMELKQSDSGVKTTCICPFYINTGMFNGVRNKLNWLVPILEEKYAAWRIITAIEQDEEVVLMPWALYPFVVLKAIMPVALTDWIMNITGMNQTMDKFKGRN